MEFTSHTLKPGETPTIIEIIDEIELVVMCQVRTAHTLLSSDLSRGSAETLLYVTLAHWDRLSRDICRSLREAKKLELENKAA